MVGRCPQSLCRDEVTLSSLDFWPQQGVNISLRVWVVGRCPQSLRRDEVTLSSLEFWPQQGVNISLRVWVVGRCPQSLRRDEVTLSSLEFVIDKVSLLTLEFRFGGGYTNR